MLEGSVHTMTVTLFTSPSCTSCRKAKAWLEEHDIPYKERNIFSEPLNIDEIKEILMEDYRLSAKEAEAYL